MTEEVADKDWDKLRQVFKSLPENFGLRSASNHDAGRLCKRNDVVLDESLSAEDHGASAFHGDHARNNDRYALAAFLALAKQGRIPPDSYLIVESLDRLTREDIRPAIKLLLDILDHRINVVTLAPERVFRQDAFEMVDMMMAVVELSRAHGESERKSERLKQTWGEKKKKASTEKRPAGRVVPAWIDVVGADGNPLPREVRIKDISGYRFKVRPEAKKVVQQIFKWAIEGDGITTITERLNDSGTTPIARPNNGEKKRTGRHWAGSYVMRILTNRATFGEFQPGFYEKRHVIKAKADPIPDYFPPVITEQIFYAARAVIQARNVRKGGGGRASTDDANPFTGLLYDVRSGVTLHLHSSDVTRRYLSPSTSRLTDGRKAATKGKGRLPGKPKVRRFPFGVFECPC